MYPTRSWLSYELSVRARGEHRSEGVSMDEFLLGLGLLDNSGNLTGLGDEYFQAKFIRGDILSADLIAKNALLQSKPVQAICQNLFGVPTASKESAASLLRFHKLENGMTERSLGTLLTMLSRFGIIIYRRGAIAIVEVPMQHRSTPSSVFVSNKTPYSNMVWLRRVIAEADHFLFWFDKHFLPAALESIWEVADGNQISEIRILSLRLEANSSKKAKRQYRDLVAELANRGVTLEWRYIDSSEVRATHDRWVIGDSKAWNVPDVGTILSGNHSEISLSPHHKELKLVFDSYWAKGTEVSSI